MEVASAAAVHTLAGGGGGGGSGWRGGERDVLFINGILGNAPRPVWPLFLHLNFNFLSQIQMKGFGPGQRTKSA